MLIGLALITMAAMHAHEVWQSLGTDRVRLGVGVGAAPFFGMPVLALGAMLRLAWTSGSGDGGWGTWLPIMVGVALLSFLVTLVVEPVVGWRLLSDGYRRCDERTAGRYMTWSLEVKGSGVCDE